jgi:hypothetical protein
MKYIAHKAHQPDSEIGMHLKAGDGLTWERRSTPYAGWIWCTAITGETGWVPESWLEFDGGTCLLLRDYDSTELTIKPGDVLQGKLIESGWLYASNQQNVTGWVPLECVDSP